LHDRTGHAEAVEVEFNPSQVSYEQLLKVFWENHDPTQLNRQGPDYGTQYRSAIFFHSPDQEQAARESKEKLQNSGQFRRPIVTQITPAVTFYEAEDYHQQYLESADWRPATLSDYPTRSGQTRWEEQNQQRPSQEERDHWPHMKNPRSAGMRP
jgi:peptide methionine sulfoxide reductase MsrA